MHPGIFNSPKSTWVTSDAFSVERPHRERIEKTSGFYDSTRVLAYLELEQCLGHHWWRLPRTQVHEYARERELRNGFCSPQQNGGNVVFFSHRNRNGGSACLFVFVPQCLWGEGATAANAVEMRPLWPTHLDHAPCLQSRPYPYPPVWMKYWALNIINDKWSNCGSDDSSCKYWRKNSYHLILIIFLSFHIKQVNCACVGFRGTDAPTTLLE